MTNLTPKNIVDKNGKSTTVHVNLDKGNAIGSSRGVGNAPVLSSVPSFDPYEFVSETQDFSTEEYFDVRDIRDVFDIYSDEINDYVSRYQDVVDSDEDDTDGDGLAFDDNESFNSLKNEVTLWNGYLNELGGSSIEIPGTNIVSEWLNAVSGVSAGWSELGENNGGSCVLSLWANNSVNWNAADHEPAPDLPKTKIKENTFYLIKPSYYTD